MPIKIPDNLPAREFLQREGLMVMRESDAQKQDIRPLKVALLNLMPLKEKTEVQIARLVGATPLQVELTLVTTGTYTPKNVSTEHLINFYQPWHAIKEQKFDGLIMTGAPVELLPFEKVAYWDEIRQILDWTQQHVHSTFNICWAAQAALYHFYKVPKHALAQKLFGLYCHEVTRPNSVLLRGFDDSFQVPVSRHTGTRRDDIPDVDGLNVLAESEESGVCLINDRNHRQVYMFNHLEYDADTLKQEYQRDLEKGAGVDAPQNYFPNDNPDAPPLNNWRAHAHLLISNWINELYQSTPFDIEEIGE